MRGPKKAIYLPEIDATVVQFRPPVYGARTEEERQENWAKARLAPWLVTYSASVGTQLAAWASLADEGVGLWDVIRLKKRPLLVGSVSSDEPGRGGLRVWDPLTGKALQRIDGFQAGRLALSHNGSRLAVISNNEIRLYAVRR